MSENSNGNGPFVRFAKVPTSIDGKSLVDNKRQHTMRFRSHFGRGAGLHRGEYPSLHQLGPEHHIMPRGGE